MPLSIDYETASVAEVEGLLEHESPFVRADAACVFGDRLRTGELSALPDTVTRRLHAMLDDREVLPRVEAAITLAEVHDPLATPILVAATRTRTFRLDAIRALGATGDSRAIPELKKLMSRWLLAWADKLQAAAALCALGDPSGAAYLEGRLQSRRPAERAAAIHFMGECHHPGAFDLLCRVLANKEDPHRDVAARTLGLLGDNRGRDILTAARQGADVELGADIADALSLLEKSPHR